MALSFASATKRIMPPWLQRSVGGRLMLALGGEIDTLVTRTAQGVSLRFPGVDPSLDTDERALAQTGHERRIRRGPREDAATYARRLRGWWDAHRGRGGPYALLEQLRAYLVDWLPVRVDVVYQSGTRRWMDEDGVITRDSITWSGDGSGKWARIWVFYHIPDAIPLPDVFLVTEAGDFLVTEDGDYLVASTTISPSEITADEGEIFTIIPREWNAAHVEKTTVVLLWSKGRLWDYPQPVPTWDAWEASGAIWSDSPVMLQAE